MNSHFKRGRAPLIILSALVFGLCLSERAGLASFVKKPNCEALLRVPAEQLVDGWTRMMERAPPNLIDDQDLFAIVQSNDPFALSTAGSSARTHLKIGLETLGNVVDHHPERDAIREALVDSAKALLDRRKQNLIRRDSRRTHRAGAIDDETLPQKTTRYFPAPQAGRGISMSRSGTSMTIAMKNRSYEKISGVSVFNIEDGSRVSNLKFFLRSDIVQFSMPDDHRVAGTNRYDMIWLWDAKTGEVIDEHSLDPTREVDEQGELNVVGQVELSPASNLVAVELNRHAVGFWEPGRETLQPAWASKADAVQAMRFSKSGERLLLLLTSGEMLEIKVADLTIRRVLDRTPEVRSAIAAVAVSEDWKLAAHEVLGDQIIVRNIEDGAELARLDVPLHDHNGTLESRLFFTHDARFLIAAWQVQNFRTGTKHPVSVANLYIFDLEKKALVRSFPIPEFDDLALSPDGKSLIGLHLDGKVRTWNLEPLWDPDEIP